jgi:flagellar basal body-associated protein FliL
MKNKINKKSNVMIIIVFIVIVLLMYIIFSFFNEKRFKPCKTCDPNELYYINIKRPPNEMIQELTKSFKNGTEMNPKMNFNNVQGTKLNYNQLPSDIQSFYENETIRNEVSKAVGEEVFYADKTEKYRIFARMYVKDDFLEWHYDNNFTKGTRYTLVIPIVVEKNSSEFMIKDRKSEEEIMIPIPIGKGVIYNGSITYHKITKQNEGLRIVVIIPFYSNTEKTIIGEIREKSRNIIFSYLTL